MRTLSVVLTIALLALIAAPLLPEAGAFQPTLTYAALAVAGALLVVLLAAGRPTAPAAVATAEVLRPQPAPAPTNPAETEIVGFLAQLQERGRLVDFLMDDVTPYSDAQVGAAARVVHQGCRAVLDEQFRITPVRSEHEGATVTVPAAYAADEYRLSGRIEGQPPFSGTLAHRGWKTEWVKLPRVLKAAGDRLPTIAPAEVELK